jgi:hypothetical protein
MALFVFLFFVQPIFRGIRPGQKNDFFYTEKGEPVYACSGPSGVAASHKISIVVYGDGGRNGNVKRNRCKWPSFHSELSAIVVGKASDALSIRAQHSEALSNRFMLCVMSALSVMQFIVATQICFCVHHWIIVN